MPPSAGSPPPDRASSGLAGPFGRRLRAIGRLVRSALHALHGLALVEFVFPRIDAAGRQRHVARWSRGLLEALGIGLEVDGKPADGPVLVVANHVSWLDIAAIHSFCPAARFVSKSEVGRWPLVGRLVGAAGTLYLERSSRRDARRVLHRIVAALAAGDTIAVFPEGTTGDGRRTLPFHANLLQAPLAAGRPVQPIALRYRDAFDATSGAARFIGETMLVQSLWRLACGEAVVVRATVLPARVPAGVDRRALASALRAEIDAVLEQADAAFTPGGAPGGP